MSPSRGPNSFEIADRILRGLYGGHEPVRQPADARAVIYAALMQKQAIDNQTQAIREQTAATKQLTDAYRNESAAPDFGKPMTDSESLTKFAGLPPDRRTK